MTEFDDHYAKAMQELQGVTRKADIAYIIAKRDAEIVRLQRAINLLKGGNGNPNTEETTP